MGNGRGHISMIFNPHLLHLSDMSEEVILASWDTLMGYFQGVTSFLAGLHP